MPIPAGQTSKFVIGHCRDIVKQHDYEAYLCAHFLPRGARALRWALGSLNVETALIKTASKSPDLATIRMKYWTEALLSDTLSNTASGNPTADVLRAFLKEKPSMRYRLKNFLATRSRDLFRSAYYTTDEIEIYGEGTYSTLLYLLLDYMGYVDVSIDHAASHLGKAQAIVSFLRGALPLTMEGIDSGFPVALLGKSGISQEQTLRDRKIWSSDAMKSVVHSLASIAWSHLTHVGDIVEKACMALEPFSVFIPAIPVRRHLVRLQEVDFDLSSKELYQQDRWLGLRLSWSIYQRHLK